MDKVRKHLTCPKCHYDATAEVSRRRYRFLLFQCPVCSATVAVYGGKVRTISDGLFEELQDGGFLHSCGVFGDIPRRGITDKDVDRLRKLLNSEQDFDRLLSQL